MAGLVLRPWRDDDAAALITAVGDPLLHRWTRVRAADAAEAQQWLGVQHAGRRTGSRYSFAVLDDAGKLVGNVALKRPDPAAEDAEVGYWTAAYARGRGIAPQALGSLTRWAFGTFPGLLRLQLLHQVDNTASCRVAVKSGYPYERTLAACDPYPLEGHVHVRDRQAGEPELAR
ncbi:acetyltransferase [Amorphoplanes auranticolor]|uniref:Acetyltransferase n=1 Tax=Actinoplanes auranticolor TaxID=47988 RepID=A0A919SGU7_9ACTN|nr:acetyltransferase [Actinoplanes auranticolor]